MAGPHEQALRAALEGAHGEQVGSHAKEWQYVAQILRLLASDLATAKLPIPDGQAGALTAEAMNAAFKDTSTAMHSRADEAELGYGALNDASATMVDVRAAYQALGPESSAPTYTPHEDPGSEEAIKAHKAYMADLASFNAAQQHREEVARQQKEKLDRTFTESAKAMQKIHGQQGGEGPWPPKYDSQGGAGDGPSTPGTAPHSVGAVGHLPTHGTGTAVFEVKGDHHGGELIDYTGDGGRHPVPGGGGGGAGGSAGAGGSGGTIGSGGGHHTGTTYPGGSATVSGDLASGTSGGGLGAGGAAGIAGGGAAAGLIGSKLVNAIKGGLVPGGGAAGAAGVAGRASTASSAVRGIGTSARTGGASTIGRGTAGAAGAGRAGAAGRSGAGGAGRAGAGGAGKAGGRGGAGAAGRGGRNKDDKKGTKRDLFDVGEDWVDDEDGAPGVLD